MNHLGGLFRSVLPEVLRGGLQPFGRIAAKPLVVFSHGSNPF